MLDDIVDFGSGYLFRFLKSVIKDFLYDMVCYAVGWVFLRVITLSKYPAESLMYGIKSNDAESLPSWVGLAIILFAAYSIGW